MWLFRVSVFNGWKFLYPQGFCLKCWTGFRFLLAEMFVHAQDFRWNVCTCTGFPLKCLYMHRISIEMFVGAQGFRLNEWKDFYSGLLFLKTENVFTHRVSDENVWKGRNSGFPFLMAENIWNVWKGCNSAFPFLWM